MKVVAACMLAVAGMTACFAPEPTTPADSNLGGVWTSNAHLFTLSQLRMNITQEPQGLMSGSWSGKRDVGASGCVATTPCNTSGSLIGRNTVGQVEIELFDGGRFEGQLLQPTKLRGIFAVEKNYDTITFVRQ